MSKNKEITIKEGGEMKVNVLVTGGKEFIADKNNRLLWDTEKRFYIGQGIWKYRNFLKYKLIPYSIYKKEIEEA